MSTEHLLLVSLGTSPGVVVGLLECLRRAQPDRPVTLLWVVTTSEPGIANNLNKLDRELMSPPFTGLRQRTLKAAGITDTLNPEDHDRMAEVLFRLVLQGHDWGTQPGVGERLFSLGIVGGRKNVSAALQQAATFFTVDAVYHLAYDGKEDEAPRTYMQVTDAISKGKLHLIPTLTQRSPWNALLGGPWGQQFPSVPLAHPSFPLNDGWSPEGEPQGQPISVEAVVGHPRTPSLRKALDEIATLAARYASPEALAAGLGREFLQHDLRDLLTDLKHHPEVAALHVYREGLRELSVTSISLADTRLKWEQVDHLLLQAMTLALGRRADSLSCEGLSVNAEGIEPVAHKAVTRGLSEGLLLIALRNLLANVRAHGDKAGGGPSAHLLLRAEDSGLLLEVRNRIPVSGLPYLLPKGASLPHELPRLLEAQEKSPGSRGSGLGLFTVRMVARRVGIDLDRNPPRVEAAATKGQFDFVVQLRFAVEAEREAPASPPEEANPRRLPVDGVVTILHLDRMGERRQDSDATDPTPLASWRAWAYRQYLAFAGAEDFAAELHRTQGPAVILLHENDRKTALEHAPLTNWLRGGADRWLLLYSGGWTDWGACERNRVLRHTGDTLPTELYGERWAAVPFEDLFGDGRLAAWFATLRDQKSFSTFCQPPVGWLPQVLPSVAPSFRRSESRHFWERMSGWLGSGVIDHYLNGDAAHPLEATARLEHLLESGDRLWLLEGYARSEGWPGVADRLCRARRAVEALLRRPPSPAGLRDEDRPTWDATIQTLTEIRNEPWTGV